VRLILEGGRGGRRVVWRRESSIGGDASGYGSSYSVCLSVIFGLVRTRAYSSRIVTDASDNRPFTGLCGLVSALLSMSGTPVTSSVTICSSKVCCCRYANKIEPPCTMTPPHRSQSMALVLGSTRPARSVSYTRRQAFPRAQTSTHQHFTYNCAPSPK
jgi:hypothetical protein